MDKKKNILQSSRYFTAYIVYTPPLDIQDPVLYCMEGTRIICARGCPSLLVALLTWWGPPGYYWLSSGQLDNCIHTSPPPPSHLAPTHYGRKGAQSKLKLWTKKLCSGMIYSGSGYEFLNSFWSGLGSSKRKNNQPRAVDPDPRGKNISNKNRKNARKLVKTASLFNSIIHCFLLLSNLLCLLKLKRTLHNLFIMLFCKKSLQLDPDPHF